MEKNDTNGLNEQIKKSQRLNKLRELQRKRAEGSQLNHKEVVEEYKRNQLPKNYAKKQEWIKYKLEEETKREECEVKGISYDRVKALEIQADEAERIEQRRKFKKNTDEGFSTYEAASIRQYNRLIKNFKPDIEEYKRMKEDIGEETFYADRDTILPGIIKDSSKAIDRMVEDLNQQLDKRAKYSRRRAFDDEADIDYINERNMRFNKKLDRFYGKFTTEIKQNLERGTAV